MGRPSALVPWSIVPLVVAVALWSGSVSAQDDTERLAREIDELAESPGAEAAAAELDRARELLSLARQARASGDEPRARSIASLAPVQLRVARAVAAAACAESAATAAERRLADLVARRAVALHRLERLLERLAALRLVAGGGR
jgi:hypothetical protein